MVSTAVIRNRLVLIAREFGTVSFRKVPHLFKAKGWDQDCDDASLISAVVTLTRDNENLFERPVRGYFKLAEDNGKPSTRAARNYAVKPLVELAYDALRASPSHQLTLSQIANYANQHHYISHNAKPLCKVISNVVSADKRFENVSRGVWKLKK